MICCALGVFVLSQIYAAVAWLFPRWSAGKVKAGRSAAAWTLGGDASQPSGPWAAPWEIRLLGGITLVLLAVVSSLSLRALAPDLGPICGHGWELVARQFWKEF